MSLRPRSSSRSRKPALTSADNNAASRTTVHFIRHADALPEVGAALNAADDYDALGLSATGIAQAGALARRMSGGRHLPAAVYSSPTLRARQTARALAAALRLDVVIDERLREMFLGELAPNHAVGIERASAIRTRLAELAALAAREGSWESVAESEPAASARTRMNAAVDAVVHRHRGRHIALVSHAGSINAYFAGLLGTARDFFFPAGNTSLSSVRFANGTAALIRLNDTAHLESLVLPATTTGATP